MVPRASSALSKASEKVGAILDYFRGFAQPLDDLNVSSIFLYAERGIFVSRLDGPSCA